MSSSIRKPYLQPSTPSPPEVEPWESLRPSRLALLVSQTYLLRKKEKLVTNASPRGTYLTISEALRVRIAEGAYPNGLPSEAEIGREFGVARTTVRRALRTLESAGDVSTVAGVGRQVGGGTQIAPYRRIMAELLERIRVGELPAGAQLPSESELAESYGVARGTVRRALHELEGAGHVQARQGVGRFVSPTP
ncbi:GntR family transcriptional regulator [Streptomyces virginiae]|uniref:GntR family transcriptional regulator n=1 Tax=Streptomyces virginiae TaxID=1961 RepID=UPI003D809AD8